MSITTNDLQTLVTKADLHGFVKRILEFGAVVELFPGTEGLCHISELAPERVGSVTDVLQEGDEVNVMVINVESDGNRTKISLSRKRATGKKAVNFFADDAQNDVPEEEEKERKIFGVIKVFLSNVSNCTVLIKCKVISGTLEMISTPWRFDFDAVRSLLSLINF